LLPITQTGLSLSRQGTLVAAFGQNPNGPGTLLRVWEQSGVTGQLVATLPGDFKDATPINLRGENIGPSIPITNGKLPFTLSAYSPASFILHE
jgi:alpha-mannosidase